MVLWLYGWEFLMVGHHTTNFGGFRNCASRKKTFPIGHMTSKDNVFEGLCDITGGNPS